MIRIEQKPFGYKITFSGIISEKEVKDWHVESEKTLSEGPNDFSVLVDMRDMELLPVVCREQTYHGQKLYKRMGMNRSVVIVKDKLTSMQFRLIAQQTGIYADERYINASNNENWENDAINWLLNSVEPEVEKELT